VYEFAYVTDVLLQRALVTDIPVWFLLSVRAVCKTGLTTIELPFRFFLLLVGVPDAVARPFSSIFKSVRIPFLFCQSFVQFRSLLLHSLSVF